MSFSRTVWMIGWGVLLFAGCSASEEVCASDDQCGPTMVCRASACVTPCASDSVCGEQAICNDGLCETGCRSDDQCPLGQSCSSGQCVNGCASSDRCEAYQYCAPNGQCLNGCGRDGDCGAGQFCEDNKCVPIGGGFDAGVACAEHDDCRVGEFCNPEGRCAVGCRPGTCPRNRRCDEATGVCVGGATPQPDAGPVSPDTGAASDAGVEMEFGVNCRLERAGNPVDSLQVRADAELSLEVLPELDAQIEWSLVRAPGDGGVLWEDRQARRQLIELQRVGSYVLRGVVTYEGVTEHCDVEVDGVAPQRGYWVELSWDGDRDLDLHLAPVPNQEPCERDAQCVQNQLRRQQCNLGYCSRSFSSRDGRDGDCWARNANPMWGDPNNSSTNPHYLGDARSGAGTENISLGALEAGWVYRVALRAWGENTNRAWLKIYRDGQVLVATDPLRIAPERPTPWLYLGRLSADGYAPVTELSAEPPRN